MGITNELFLENKKYLLKFKYILHSKYILQKITRVEYKRTTIIDFLKISEVAKKTVYYNRTVEDKI